LNTDRALDEQRKSKWEQEWRQAVLEPMSEEARRQVAVYATCRTFSAGQPLPIPNQEWFAPADCELLFVDLMPRANWGHPCRYVLMDEVTNQILEAREWEFPPARDLLRLVYAGEAVESWMLLTED
jgi:hypothetical protein